MFELPFISAKEIAHRLQPEEIRKLKEDFVKLACKPLSGVEKREVIEEAAELLQDVAPVAMVVAGAPIVLAAGTIATILLLPLLPIITPTPTPPPMPPPEVIPIPV